MLPRALAALPLVLLLACSADGGDPPPLAAPSPSGPPPFSRAMVRLKIETKRSAGGQVHIHFVNPRPGADLAEGAKLCVKDFTQPGQYLSAFCYAYDSDADLDRAAVSKTTSIAKRYCWRASHAKGIDGGEAGGPNTSYVGQGCPGEKASPSETKSKSAATGRTGIRS